jgi:threonine/homoserine/homoserine lactone efflux protein
MPSAFNNRAIRSLVEVLSHFVSCAGGQPIGSPSWFIGRSPVSISSYWPSLLAVYGASLIAFLSPGPNFAGIVSSAVFNRLNGVFVAIGVSLGTAIWALLAVTGITALLSRYPYAALVMQTIGGSYLLWLGFKSLRSALKKSTPMEVREASDETRFRSFLKGLFIQLTNPKPALFWLSIVSVAIAPNTPIVVGLLLVAGVTIIAIIWHLILAFAFSIEQTRAYYLQARGYISFAFGIFFIALGGRLILDNMIHYWT